MDVLNYKYNSLIKKLFTIVILFLIIFIVIFVSIAKYKKEEINYRNSDATWHTLLTITAYDETPIMTHLFLPIVSLGSKDDKNITWGATLPDKKGNYYYTSFSPAGFIAPYLFIKIFNLDFTEKSIYVFNTFLFSLSAMLWFIFLLIIYNEKGKIKYLLSFIGTLVYIYSTEILHGMGIVYWNQSLLNVTLIIQFISYYIKFKNNNNYARIVFYIFCVINPYIEWTGYIANIGFAIIEFFTEIKKDKKRAVKEAGKILLLTMSAFLIFTIHYLLVVNPKSYFKALFHRFMARNILSKTSFLSLLSSYIETMGYLWVFLFVLLFLTVLVKKTIVFENLIVYFMLFFPLIENIVMKEHAYSYTYDKMKFSFLFSFIICELFLQTQNKLKKYNMVLLSFLLVFCFLNFKSYNSIDNNYIWKTNYREDNIILANYIKNNYKNSVLGIEGVSVRGYMNLLFHRGIYENTNLEKLKIIAKKQNKKYAILLNVKSKEKWNIYKLGGVVVDVLTDDIYEIIIKDKKIVKVEEEKN